MGTPAFAAASLESLHDAGHDCVAVVTRPDARAGRGLKRRPSAVRQVATKRGLRVLQPRTLRGPEGEAFREACSSLSPDVAVVVAYGRILPQSLIDLPHHGAVNVHASLLPKYRGAAPIAWAIARGEARTGITTMQMTADLDAGDILMQEAIPIQPDDTAGSLERRLADLGAVLIVRTLDAMSAGSLDPVPQDPEKVTWAPLISRQDGRIDWATGAASIERRLRAFDPWPGAWTTTPSGKEIRIRTAIPRPAASRAVAPGTVIGLFPGGARDGVEVACGEGSALVLIEVQPAGRRVMSAREAASGRHLVPGERLG